MKKLLALMLVACLLLTGCSLRTVIETADSVLETAPELQRVETTTLLVHGVTTEYADGREEKQTFEFDNRNFPLSCTYYLDGNKTGTDTYTVDEYGSILSVTPDYEGGKVRTYSYTYDENGNMLTEESYLEDKLDYTAKYPYNEDGTLAKKLITNANGHRAEYFYDSMGRETEHLYYEADVLISRTVTEYAEHGKRQKVTVFDADGNVTCWEDYSFDKKSSKETVLEYTAEGELLQKRIVSYDTYGMPLMQEVFRPDGDLVSTTYWHNVAHNHVEYTEVPEPTP